jgi:hypothetical protein
MAKKNDSKRGAQPKKMTKQVKIVVEKGTKSIKLKSKEVVKTLKAENIKSKVKNEDLNKLKNKPDSNDLIKNKSVKTKKETNTLNNKNIKQSNEVKKAKQAIKKEVTRKTLTSSKEKQMEGSPEEAPQKVKLPKVKLVGIKVESAEGATALIKKWTSLQKKSDSKGLKAQVYNMTKSYEAQTPIEHKVLGWGYILNNINNRLEVLFKDGVKYLISNYK